MTTLIREIMSECIVTVRVDATLGNAVEIFTKNHVGGAPVISADGAIVGMISELQLLDVVFDEAARDALVSDYMTRDVVVVGPDEPLSQAAKLFALYSFRRLPVVERDRLVGMVTRRDLMQYSLKSGELLTDPLFALVPEIALHA
jgi:CBS domain-containing protein